MADGSAVLKEMDGWPGEKEAGWIKSYNPEEKVIVFVLRVGTGISGYFIGGPTLPAVAYAKREVKQKAERN